MSTMGTIRLHRVDFSSLSVSANEYVIGIDTDGLPKLKRSTDTIILGASASNITEYYTVTYSQFKNLVDTNGLQPGGLYLVTDFRTIHYIQYTDSNGDGTSLDEVVNTASVEQILVLATSNNSYSHDVKSTTNVGDDIRWIHYADDRVLDHANPVGGGKGVIYYRKSSFGNERGYDFRGVIFRRWNDGSGNYNVIRKIDAPVPGDYISRFAFEESYELNNNNVVKSNITGTQSGDYYMDNLVMATSSLISDNTINDAHGVHIGGQFINNTINNIRHTVFGASSSVIANDLYVVSNSYIESTFQANQLKVIASSTFSNLFQDCVSNLLDYSSFGTASDNMISRITRSSIDILSWNTGNVLRDSNITILDRNTFNRIENVNSDTIDLNMVNYIENETTPVITGNEAISITGNTASYISNNNSNTISGNISGTISNNQVLYIKRNENTGNIEWNQGLRILENTSFINDISYNNCGVIATNSGTGSISFNTSEEILNNSNVGDIDYNQVVIISDNSNAGDISVNIGSIITLNTCDEISDNIVDQIMANDTIDGGKGLKQNTGFQIINNVSNAIVDNNVNRIALNQVESIDKNVGYRISDNTGTASGQNITNNSVVDIYQNTLIGTIQNNVGYTIRQNTGDINNNIANSISSNVGTFSRNNVNYILSNTSSNTSRNIGMTISNNNSIITDNSVYNIQFNTVNLFDNDGISMINNHGAPWPLFLPSSSFIMGNNVTTVNDNTTQQISNNVGSSINSNYASSNPGIIDNNNVSKIESNQNYSNINYNNGNNISNNSFSTRIFSGSTATFSYAGTGTPSIGDTATISYSIYSQNVVCSVASIDGFVNQIYGLFPNAGFTATYSNNVFTLTAPTSVTSYEGALLSVNAQGTQSLVVNASFAGGGKNDLVVDASGFTWSAPVHYVVVISATSGAIADKYDWFDDKGNTETGITVSLTNYELSYGAQISFGSFTGHDMAANWDFDIIPSQSAFGPTFSDIFSGETVATFSDVSYNNINDISSNVLCQIKWNTGNTIKNNNNLTSIERNNLSRIENNGAFSILSNSSGNKVISTTGSTVRIFNRNRSVDIASSIIGSNVQNHTFLDSIDLVIITPSTAMGWSTQSTTSRYLVNVDRHHEEIVNTSGMTWSAI